MPWLTVVGGKSPRLLSLMWRAWEGVGMVGRVLPASKVGSQHVLTVSLLPTLQSSPSVWRVPVPESP